MAAIFTDMGGCSEGRRQEFRPKHFLLQHDDPQTFIQFQFGHQHVYLGWRIFWALYHVGWIIISGVRADLWASDSSQYVKWFILLTHWAYFSLTLSTVVDACVVLYIFCKRADIRQGSCSILPWYMRASWCLVTIGNTASVVITVAYWAIIYKGTYQLTSIHIATHGINCIYVIGNLCVTGMPTRFLHFWYPVLFGLTYVVFSVFYHVADGTNHYGSPYIYPPLDWHKPRTAIVYSVIVVFVVMPITHFVLFGMHSLKVLVYAKCDCCHPSQERYDIKSGEKKGSS